MTRTSRAALLALAAAASITEGFAQEPAGDVLYRNYCAACHGVTGEGDGPVAGVMQIAVPNLRTLAMRSGGQFPVDAVTDYVDGTRIPLAHGSRQMPVWGDVFAWDDEGAGASSERAERHVAAIVAYLAELQY